MKQVYDWKHIEIEQGCRGMVSDKCGELRWIIFIIFLSMKFDWVMWKSRRTQGVPGRPGTKTRCVSMMPHTDSKHGELSDVLRKLNWLPINQAVHVWSLGCPVEPPRGPLESVKNKQAP